MLNQLSEQFAYFDYYCWGWEWWIYWNEGVGWGFEDLELDWREIEGFGIVFGNEGVLGKGRGIGWCYVGWVAELISLV